jgi:hypothetical protein
MISTFSQRESSFFMIGFNNIEEIWCRVKLLRQIFQEYIFCLKDLYSKTESILKTSLHIPEGFRISQDKIPEDFFLLRKNIFSTLFQSVYWLLGIEEKRRFLYGKLNHLFRIWVTCADNLLDNESKIVIPLKLPSHSHIMQQVISIMTADRIMKQILDEALEEKVISLSDSKFISERSLQILLPSAAEEASEEKGINQRVEPDYVLYTIHRLKTGLLFHIPFLGPENIEKNINKKLLLRCKEALDKFGLGCQLLDDIRDMAKDYLGKRHNYVISKIYWENIESYSSCLEGLEREIDASSKIHFFFPRVVYPTAELAKHFLQEGLSILDRCGLNINKDLIELMAFTMFRLLDVEDLIKLSPFSHSKL